MHRPKSFNNLEIGLQSLTRRQLEHHVRLYHDDLRRLNALEEELAALRAEAHEDTRARRTALRRNEPALWSSVLLHELYFEALGHDEKVSQELGAAVDSAGGRERVLGDLRDAALVGPGWALLLWDRAKGGLRVAYMHERHVAAPFGHDVLLALDTWEHAYFTDYGPEREAYLAALLRDVSWGVVSRRLADLR